MASLKDIEEFVNGALVSWLESCLPHPEILSGYTSLLDGSIIQTVWLQIDPAPQHHLIKFNGLDGVALCNARAKNFDAIIRNLKSLYEEELGQVILTLPDCSVLGYSSESQEGLEQMKILLILLLGAAVQCPNKETFIKGITELDLNTQHAIVELIKKVTDTPSVVLNKDAVNTLDSSKMYRHLINLVKERDNFHSKLIASLVQDSETDRSRSHSDCSELPSNSVHTSSSMSENNHLAVELADLKSKLRKLRQELEEKSEAFIELKEELQHKNSQHEKLRIESQLWYSEAKTAKTYRDEVDALRDKVELADRLELEVQKLREKITDAEFYKVRVDELLQDQKTLMEHNEMLDGQLKRSRKKSDNLMALESEIIKYKQKLNDMALERDVDKAKLQELLEENTQLQLLSKNFSTGQDSEKSLSDAELDCNSGDNSLSEQLTNNAQTRVLKLELENRRLLASLDQLKETNFHESANRILELEKEKKRLSLKNEQLNDNSKRLTEQNKELEEIFKNALEENKKLQRSLDQRQEANEKLGQDKELQRNKLNDLEKHVEIVNKEKQRLQTLNESIQRRAEDIERSLEIKINEVDSLSTQLKESDMLKNDIYDLQSKLNSFERENISLSKEVTKLKDQLEHKSVQFDEEIVKMESLKREKEILKKELEASSILLTKVQEIENQNRDLLSEKKIDLETISTLQKHLVDETLETNKVRNNLEKLGIQNSEFEDGDLNVEHVVEKLVTNPETFKTVCEVMLNCAKQNSKSDMCVLCHRKEIFTVEKNIEISVVNDLDAEKSGRPENLLTINTSKWKEQYHQMYSTNAILQVEFEELQAENAKQKVNLATLESKICSLNAQHTAMQLENSQLAAEKDVLLKNVETRKQEQKNLLDDQVTLRCLHEQLSCEYESLIKEKETLKSMLRELRNENRDLKDKCLNFDKSVENMKHEMGMMKTGVEDLATLRAEHSKLTDDFRNLFTTNDRFKNEYKNIQEQYKLIRAENSRLRLQNTDLTGEINQRMDQFKSLEMEYSKTTQRCEMLLQMNSNLDSDRRTLMDHVSQLLSQYHELLSHSLEDKQHYHDEEKNYTDKVNHLNRQKEKLEEKIMEHYRKLDSCAPKKKAFGSNFVKRMKKASTDLMNKVPNRNRRSWIEESRLTQSQYTLGSESGGNESDNSTEDLNSTASDSNAFQKNVHSRMSLQRTNDKIEMFSRGGVRGSLQSLKREETSNSRRNSVHGLDPPDVTGSSLTLGTAGSRRTVYLVDENQKIPETHTQSASASEALTPTNNKDSPSTFLMYNRITNTVATGAVTEPPTDVTSTVTTSIAESTTSNTKKRPEDKNNSIWYEYGCV